MTPTWMRVPANTTVTFTNPANNANTHCATQFFEGGSTSAWHRASRRPTPSMRPASTSTTTATARVPRARSSYIDLNPPTLKEQCDEMVQA
jgi:hypothetical protein